MKAIMQWGRRGVLALALVACVPGALWAQQGAKPNNGTKVSQGEADLAKKLQSASGLDNKFKIANDFLKKYPTSTIRPKVADFMLVEIANTKDPAQKISGVETYLGVFTEASEQEKAVPVLLDGYIAAQRWEDAFGLAPRVLEKKPDSLDVLTRLAVNGTNQMRADNRQYVDQSRQYAAQSVTIMEADKKPAEMTDTNWAEYKKAWLPIMYQAQAFLAMDAGKRAEARTGFQKAAKLAPADPVNYYVQGVISNDEYQALAKEYKVTPNGPARDAVLLKVNAKLDEVIELYAQTIAVAANKPEQKQLADQVMQDLQSYYKFRKGSLNGLQAVIDKYKK